MSSQRPYTLACCISTIAQIPHESADSLKNPKAQVTRNFTSKCLDHIEDDLISEVVDRGCPRSSKRGKFERPLDGSKGIIFTPV